MEVICPNCEREFEPPFTPRRGSRILCRVCFAESRGDLDMAFAEIAWRQGYQFGYRQGQRDAASGDTPALISEALVNDALILTHPDRHPSERFTAANSVTARLIALRDSIRRIAKQAPSRVQ